MENRVENCDWKQYNKRRWPAIRFVTIKRIAIRYKKGVAFPLIEDVIYFHGGTLSKILSYFIACYASMRLKRTFSVFAATVGD